MMLLHGHYMMYDYQFGSYNPGGYGGEFCFEPLRNVTRWCVYGCCGEHDTDCCHASVALIVGVSILSLFVICCVIAACCCCCIRYRRAAHAGQVLSMQPPSYDSTTEGTDCTCVTPGGVSADQPQLPPYPTQNYPPGCYAPPAYSEVQQSSSSSSSTTTTRQAYSIPLPPPPYSRELTGQDNKAFQMSE